MMLDIVFYMARGFEQFLLKSNLMVVIFTVVLLLPYVFKDWMRVLSLLAMIALGFLFNATINFFEVVAISATAFRGAYWTMLGLLFLFCFYRLICSGKKLKNKGDTIYYVIAFVFGFIASILHENIWRPLVAKSSYEFIALFGYSLGYLGGLILVGMIYFLAAYALQTILRFTQKEWGLIVSSMSIGVLISEWIKII
ncbi:hypothetical protein [Flavobacterium sp. NKUCC04_CG]|uniref:hypothetical protein n=1 Tax=Flavobacterium sp. NKUCC04_CG TaxID=2842121 RepID=UPI001C5B5EA5|nr:hypothetical protein [Flavobacterium sp. NKUCC04_CG]MBW3518373.1 hypothetical protein [Flavobacterium sp. NKUCC04_CG]